MSEEDIKMILLQVSNSLKVVTERGEPISSVDDFLQSPEGMMRLDSICMQLVTIGEAIKSIDRYTNKTLLTNYPSIDWKGVMGLRDIIVHQYFNVDAEIIYDILKNKLPGLKDTIERIIIDLQ